MTRATGLNGRVAKILNARELVINIGLDSGVEEGMIFAVLAESPVKITDPETGEALGELDREKIRVKATDVLQRIAVCRTFRRRGSLSHMDIDTLIRAGLSGSEVETLKATDNTSPEPLSPEESYVLVNDRVILVEDF